MNNINNFKIDVECTKAERELFTQIPNLEIWIISWKISLGNIERSYVLHSKQLDTCILQGLEILGLKDQREVTTLYHDLLKRENYIARILSHFDRINSKSNIGTSTIATISYHCIRHAAPLGHQWSFNKYVTVKVSILTLLTAPPPPT